MKRVIFVSLLILVWASLGYSQELATGKTTAEFLKTCEFVIDSKKRPEDFEKAYFNTGICHGYISGFVDAIPVLQEGFKRNVFCLPTSGIKNNDVLICNITATEKRFINAQGISTSNHVSFASSRVPL